jgi:hypothetical protein
MSSNKQYSMVQECTDRYEAKRSDTGDLEISIRVPRRFADLWLVKLSGLRTTDSEITEYEPDPGGRKD